MALNVEAGEAKNMGKDSGGGGSGRSTRPVVKLRVEARGVGVQQYWSVVCGEQGVTHHLTTSPILGPPSCSTIAFISLISSSVLKLSRYWNSVAERDSMCAERGEQ